MDGESASANAEWRQYWPLVLSAFLGMSFYSLFAYSNQMFVQPLEKEFGWPRRDMAFGYSIFAFVAFLLGPFIGALIDKFGARRIAVPGLALSSLAFAALGFATGNVATWFALWLILGIVGISVKSTVWTVAISNAFSRHRALALSVMLSGSALAQMGAPILGRWLIPAYGWRHSYFIFGLGWGGLALLLAIFMFHDAKRPAPAAGQPKVELPGLGFWEAVKSRPMILIFAANLLNSLMGSGITFQLKPILSDTSLGESGAALVAATAGITGIIGKIGSGWLLDRSESKLIPALSFGIGALAFLLILDLFQAKGAVLAGVLIYGLYTGAGLSVTAFLVSRYVGLRSFGAVYGLLGSMLMLGTALGPPIGAAIYDAFHTYHPLLWAVIPICLLNGFLMLFLGAYPDFSTQKSQA
ncbi:MAG: MFS transporter [Novosphingobium sp.]